VLASRRKADETGHAQALACTRRDGLVEHDLGTVRRVAEVGFPRGQRRWLGKREAILEAEHSLFRRHRVDDFVMRLLRPEIVERNMPRLVLLVVKNRMALRERTALGILT